MTNQNHPTTISPRVNWRVGDFCAAHGICRTTFYKAAKRGEIKTFKVGRRTLIADTEARAWQASQQEDGE